MQNKRCAHCQIQKPVGDYRKDCSRKDGLYHSCKTCEATMRDPEKERARHRQKWTDYKQEHPDKVKANNRRFRQNNRGRVRAYIAQHRADKIRATPPWADRESMRKIYEGANYLTRLTWEQVEVDHIIPLRSKRVCGLHVPENLQYLTRSENAQKCNKF